MLACALSAASCLASSAPVPPPDAAIDPSVYVLVDQPLLVELEQRFEVVGELGSFRVEHDWTFVDVHTRLEDDVEEGYRYFVRAHSRGNGEVADPPWNGLRVHFAHSLGGTDVRLRDGGSLPRHHLERMLVRDHPSLGLWLRFPESMRVGDEVELDLLDLARILADDLVTLRATAQLVLESHDHRRGHATFTGTAWIDQRAEEGQGVFRHTLACTLTTDLKARHVRTLSLEGGFVFDGPVDASGNLSVKLEARRGRAAERALERAPRFRRRTFSSARFGLALQLPSYWVVGRPDDPAYWELVPSLEPTDEVAIQLSVIADRSDDPETYLTLLEARYESDPSYLGAGRARSGLGKGRAFRFERIAEAREGAGGTRLLRTELYPFHGAWLVCKLSGSPAAFRKYEPEFERAVRSLRILPAPD